MGEDLENPAAVIDRLLDETTGDQSGVDEIEKFLRESGAGDGSGDSGNGNGNGNDTDGPARDA